MTRTQQIIWGIVAGVVLSGIITVVPDEGFWIVRVMVVVTAVGLLGGRLLPVFVRVFFTLLIFFFGGAMALAGRAMEPGISAYTVGHALQMFALLALWPALTLLRLWGGRLRIILISTVLPVSLILAFAAAGIEEFIFVQKYKAAGVGPTNRWTIPEYWLSYDAQTGKLSGSD